MILAHGHLLRHDEDSNPEDKNQQPDDKSALTEVKWQNQTRYQGFGVYLVIRFQTVA